MKHTIRIQRHVLRDILASVAGGALVVAVVQRSWVGGVIAVVVGIALFIEEKSDIEEEEREGLG